MKPEQRRRSMNWLLISDSWSIGCILHFVMTRI
jgi:hypothetical protein